MYRKSILISILALALAGIVFAGPRLVSAVPGSSKAPSSYAPRLTLTEAIKTSKNPLLVEFYTDSCLTCREITPWVHQLAKKYKNELTLVMVDVDDPKQERTVDVFRVDYVPAIFVFDAKRMATAKVNAAGYSSIQHLERAIKKAMQQAKA